MRWYQNRWWYVERPFPWVLIGAYASVPLLIVVILCLALRHF